MTQAIRRIRSCTVVLANRDIDTDQIMPARFLTATSRSGFGKHLFYDLRFDRNGNPREDFALNRPDAANCEVLVAGHNFGCGSSREHAPWALLDFGIRAVISTAIADIFRNNALKNGLLPIIVDRDVHDWLLQHPGALLDIDVVNSTLTLPDGATVGYPIDDFARYCLVEGLDQLGFLLQQLDEITAYEERGKWMP